MLMRWTHIIYNYLCIRNLHLRVFQAYVGHMQSVCLVGISQPTTLHLRGTHSLYM
jgi:hypothetical protein